MSAVMFSPSIGPVFIDCFISERHYSDIEISENPIEDGSVINDHAYLKPKKLTLEIAGAAAAITFSELTRFQRSRVPFTLVTGLLVYNNMLIKSVSADRDKNMINVLRATVDLQEIVIVNTGIVSVDVSNVGKTPKGNPGGKKSTKAANPSDVGVGDRSAGTVQRGDSPMKPAENTSILNKVFN